MQQADIDKDKIINIDYEDKTLPAIFRQFRPALYLEDQLYICLLGPGEEEGIVGRGATEQEAIDEWMIAFKDRFESTNEEDELARYIRDTFEVSKRKVN